MNCPVCQLSYNKNRKPLVLFCGHTFCSECLETGQECDCPTCKTHSKAVVNFAMYEQVTKKNQSNIDKYIKICLFGNMNVGKSSILRRLIDDEFQYQTNPTIGIDFKYVDKDIDGKIYRFQIWDSAGQERYRSMSSHHLKGSDIILLVYDVARGYEENGLMYWIGEIENYAKHNNIIVIGNKMDLIQNVDAQKHSNTPALLPSEIKAIEKEEWKKINVSCLSSMNFEELWEIIISKSKVSNGVTASQKLKSVILQTQKQSPSTQSSFTKNKSSSHSTSVRTSSKCC